MRNPQHLVGHVSDTARWAAWHRAEENDRPDALFRDPHARRLAGARGDEIAAAVPKRARAAWPWIMRGILLDRIIAEQVAQGVDMVVNLAAGLDARPYRMELPAQLTWVEVDLPQILQEKRQILDREKPRCHLERVGLDLSDVEGRRALFAALGARSRKALVISEGLLIYLTPDDVRLLAGDLAAVPAFRAWTFDMAAPPLVRLLQQTAQKMFGPDVPKFSFAPVEGPDFFLTTGWKIASVSSTFHEAARLRRVPFLLRLFALSPDSPAFRRRHPWTGVCLLTRD